VDLDLEKFFDTVNQSKLIEVLSGTIKDGRVISLIHRYLRAGVITANKFETTVTGVPQGGPLSPLLSNIMLNELDRELETRGHRFVRYADDLLILCKSKRGASRTMGSIIRYIEQRLYLKVNREKSTVATITGVKFLGYSFYQTKGEGRLRIHPKSVGKMRSRIRDLTSRSNGWGNARRKEALKQFIVGWVNYFRLADMRKLMLKADEWYRRRIRMVVWKQWKQIKTRMANLVRLGVNKAKAREHANSRKGYWHLANSWVLSTTLTTERLRVAGYTMLLDSYLVAQKLN
jgi:group II intron reverse transcriptase/maturase